MAYSKKNEYKSRGCRLNLLDATHEYNDKCLSDIFIFYVNDKDTVGIYYENGTKYECKSIDKNGKYINPSIDILLREYKTLLNDNWIDMKIEDINSILGICSILYDF